MYYFFNLSLMRHKKPPLLCVCQHCTTVETLAERLSEKLRERLGERFGEMICQRLYDMLDPNKLQVCFWQASSFIKDSLNGNV